MTPEIIWFVYLLLIIAVIIALIRVGKLTGPGEHPPARTCPVCGSDLAQGETLFADEIRKNEKESELRIKGCPHCYKKGGQKT